MYAYVRSALSFVVVGPPEGGPIFFFTFTGSVRNVRNDVYIYIYIYIYVNNMADAKSVRNLSAIFR